MAQSISFLLATTLVLIGALAPQNSAAAGLSAYQRPAIKPSRMSVYVTKASNENQNKLRQKIGTIVGYPVPTVTRTAYDLQTVTIIKTTVSTVVETTIINAIRDTSVYVGVPVTVTALAKTATVYVQHACPNRVFPEVFSGVNHDALKPEIEEPVTKIPEIEKPTTKKPEIKKPEIGEKETYEQGSVQLVAKKPDVEPLAGESEDKGPVTGESNKKKPEMEIKPQEDSMDSLMVYLQDFNSMMGNLEVPKNRKKVMLSFIKYTSENSLQRTTNVQKRIIKEQLQSLCEQGKLAEIDSEPFFLQLAGFVAYLKNSIKRS